MPMLHDQESLSRRPEYEAREDPIPNGAARKPRRRLSPEARRRELLDAAVRVLRRRDPSDCRVADVTAEAQTAKGNFYRYFPTWDDLLIAVRDEVIGEYALEVARRLTTRRAGDEPDVLEREANAFIDFQLDTGGLHDAVFHGPAGRGPHRGARHPAAAVMETIIAAAGAAPPFTRVDARPIATLIFHVLHGAADEIIAGGDARAIRAAATDLVKCASRSTTTRTPTSGS
jgi:AcrR family transcriptional regulator